MAAEGEEQEVIMLPDNEEEDDVVILSETPGNRPTKVSDLAPRSWTPSFLNLDDPSLFLLEAPSFVVPYLFEGGGWKAGLGEELERLAEQVRRERQAKLERGEALREEDALYQPLGEGDYFHSPIGSLLMGIGKGLVEEWVQVELLKQQKRQGEREKRGRGGSLTHLTQQSIAALQANVDESRGRNGPFKAELKSCGWCNFKSESELVVAAHRETPHKQGSNYQCGFCGFLGKWPSSVMCHVETKHGVRLKWEGVPAPHPCPICPEEFNSSSALTRHLVFCQRHFFSEKNLKPPAKWENPAKLPSIRLPQNVENLLVSASTENKRKRSGVALFSAIAKRMRMDQESVSSMWTPTQTFPTTTMTSSAGEGGSLGQPSSPFTFWNKRTLSSPGSGLGQVVSPNMAAQSRIHAGMMSQWLRQVQTQFPTFVSPPPSVRERHQTQAGLTTTRDSTPTKRAIATPCKSPSPRKPKNSKTFLVICEVCDLYVEDLDKLRGHLEMLHGIKIHPKAIFGDPPLHCQKCKFKFFTDQGLERHLLGYHGLVTSALQDTAEKGQDGGRCPLCKKTYIKGLMAHVAISHKLTLKPAHLSYKCTICKAVFDRFKIFEQHVYSAHTRKVPNAAAAPRPLPPPSSPSAQLPPQAAQSQQKKNQVSSTLPAPALKHRGQGNRNGLVSQPILISNELSIIPHPHHLATSTATRGSSPSVLTITRKPIRRRALGNNKMNSEIEVIDIDTDDQPTNKASSEAPMIPAMAMRGDARQSVLAEELRKRNVVITLVEGSPGKKQQNN